MSYLKLESSDDLRWSYLVVPTLFFTRRLILVLTIFFVTEYLWLQIYTQLFIATAYGCHLLSARPMRPFSVNRLEVVNEIAIICTCYAYLCFTDFVRNAEGQHYSSYGYVSIATLLICLHILLLIAQVASKLRLHLIKCFNKMRARRNHREH